MIENQLTLGPCSFSVDIIDHVAELAANIINRHPKLQASAAWQGSKSPQEYTTSSAAIQSPRIEQ